MVADIFTKALPEPQRTTISRQLQGLEPLPVQLLDEDAERLVGSFMHCTTIYLVINLNHQANQQSPKAGLWKLVVYNNLGFR